MRNINKFAFFAFALVATTAVAHADIISDQLAKAEKAVTSANTRLEKAKACAAIHDQCLADMKAKAEKRLTNAQKRLQQIAAN